jgi:hypothetical protein
MLQIHPKYIPKLLKMPLSGLYMVFLSTTSHTSCQVARLYHQYQKASRLAGYLGELEGVVAGTHRLQAGVEVSTGGGQPGLFHQTLRKPVVLLLRFLRPSAKFTGPYLGISRGDSPVVLMRKVGGTE